MRPSENEIQIGAAGHQANVQGARCFARARQVD